MPTSIKLFLTGFQPADQHKNERSDMAAES
jgi:hypothetical protein